MHTATEANLGHGSRQVYKTFIAIGSVAICMVIKCLTWEILW